MDMIRQIFPYGLIAFLCGASLGLSFDLSPAAYLYTVMLLVSGLLMIGTIKRAPSALMCVILIMCGVLGALRAELWNERPRSDVLEARVGQSAHLTGLIVEEPDQRETETKLTVRAIMVDQQPVENATENMLLVSVPAYPEYAYGERIDISGKLEHPKSFVEHEGRSFDYPAYLASHGIMYQMHFPKITITAVHEGSRIIEGLYGLKHRFLSGLSLVLPEPENGLLAGLLLGGKRSIGTMWSDVFRTAGIVHIVVLSGYNMTVVADWLMKIFAWSGFYGSISLGALGIILFSLMAGGGATVVRAAVMALIALLARATGRTYTMSRALLVAAVMMVVVDPSIILHDPSFQLSFLAALGLILVSPVVERRTRIFSKHPVMREVFVSTLSTQLIVLPLLLFQTGSLSLVSLPVNMLVLPVIPLAMLSGFATGLLALISPVLGKLVVLPCLLVLAYVMKVAWYASLIPYASVDLPVSLVVMFALYIVLGMIIFLEHRSFRHRVTTLPEPLLNSGDDRT